MWTGTVLLWLRIYPRGSRRTGKWTITLKVYKISWRSFMPDVTKFSRMKIPIRWMKGKPRWKVTTTISSDFCNFIRLLKWLWVHISWWVKTYYLLKKSNWRILKSEKKSYGNSLFQLDGNVVCRISNDKFLEFLEISISINRAHRAFPSIPPTTVLILFCVGFLEIEFAVSFVWFDHCLAVNDLWFWISPLVHQDVLFAFKLFMSFVLYVSISHRFLNLDVFV